MFKGNNKSRDNIAYWMLADTELPIAKEKSFENSFEAHFKHGLLFNEKIMISDAQAVNCVNLRNLIRKKNNFKELITPDLLSIAVRDPLGTSKGQHLSDVRDAFHKERKQHMPDAEFLEDYDLALLNEQSNIVPYTYDALRDNYTNGIFKIFSGHKARTIFGLDTQQILLERLQRESERDKGLGRIFLQQNFKDDLKKIGKLDVWQKHKKDIISLSDAPYVTGIPQILRTNPIYSPSHQESFQLAYTQKPEIIEKGTGIDMSTGLNLSTYEQALAMLQPDDIFFLRDTYEFRQYQKHVRNGVSTDSQLDNALMALKAYQRQIDELIIRRKLGEKTPKSFKGKRFIEPIRKISQEGSVTAFGLTLVEPTSAVALSIANFFLSELLGKREKLSADRIELEKEKLVSNIKRESNGEPKKIEAHQFSSTDINETIYTSVSMSAKQ